MRNPKVDSKEGIEIIMNWARACRFVLNEWHEMIAKKYGISTEGVMISRRIL